MEHRKFSKHIVLSILYDVNPSQVKQQTGSFAEAYADNIIPSKINISSYFNEILHVQNKLYRTALYVPPYLVGIDFLVTCINWWLGDGSNKVGIATIYGIGGIGKTTIAKVVYNLNIQKFEEYSFLDDVRETTQECNGLVHLQRHLILDILKGKANKIYNLDDGITKIKEPICRRRVLLVLDDVFDLEASSSYGDLCKGFEVKELAFNESLQLFNQYAFG
ncbi:NB-ARC - like 10 [Theobroma cacao]|nr:NB-ARC - like 10 [Theobroma cacao]